MGQPIRIFNRQSGTVETESVYGRRWVDLCYDNFIGRCLTALFLARRPLSHFYGYLQQLPRSRRQISGFIKQYNIDLAQVVTPPGGFGSFNDFFIRRLKPEGRPVSSDPQTFISPADSRLQVFDLETEACLRVKGIEISLPGLLGLGHQNKALWNGGTALVFRLAPCDYHRFGHVADGVQGRVHSIPGNFHSVNPLAMRHKPDVLMTNFRQWCFVQSPLWGTLIQVEVGAMMVGSIVQHRPNGGPCLRGQEKGYFQFGGSTVVVILEPNRIQVDAEILDQTAQGIETLIRYGEAVGRRIA